MAFFRLYPTKDTWITNQILDNQVGTAETANLGANPTLQVFKVTGSHPSSAAEIARTLLQFDMQYLSGLVFNEQTIPSTGVSYYLRAFHYPITDTVPTSFDLQVWPLSQSWDEGSGVDNLNYRDYGYANWLSASSTTAWATTGGSFISGAIYGSASQHFDRGYENLECDVTRIVNNWLTASAGQAGGLPNYGLMLKLGNSEETNLVDYWRKAFYGRETQYVEFVPYLEARWNDVRKDNRGNFAYNQSSSLYFYNFVRNALQAPAQPVLVRLQDHPVGISASYNATVTASLVENGIFSATFVVSNTASFSSSWRDVWFSGNQVYMSGVFAPLVLTGSQVDPYSEFTIDVTNLKRVYRADELAHLKVNVRRADYQNHVLISSASLATNREYIENMYYSIVNNENDAVIVPFATGSVPYTQLSYNKDGNYFNMWMNSFVPGFVYRILFLIQFNKYDKKVIDSDFLFKVI